MIRLEPSVICLAPSDLLDYEDRRKERELENVKKQFARFEIGATEGSEFGRSRKHQTSSKYSFNPAESFKTGVQLPYILDHSLSGDGHEEPRRYPIFAGPPSSAEQSSLPSCVTSPENFSQISVEVQQSSSPPKDGFHYGGFVESQHSTDYTPRRSSPFAPDDVSTPQNLLHVTDRTSARARARTLPRSPLYYSHNASSSPDGRPTSSLTPRVASRVANHNTPGIIFAQPARRPAFRHQTNSFSFDSSERSSAAYEQDRISSLSTTNTTPMPPTDLRLRDELRGSSLTSSILPDSEEGEDVDDQILDTTKDFIFSSPELPPPFSTTLRRASDAIPIRSSELNNFEPVHAGHQFACNPASPVIPSADLSNSEIHGSGIFRSPGRNSANRSPEMGDYPVNRPPRRSDHEIRSNPHSDRPSRMSRSPELNNSNNRSRTSPMSLLRSAARVVSYYRPRSPSTASPPSTRAQSLRSRHQTLSRYLTVYNDTLPPQSQPQTPAQLPESRHQSRYHPAYTAPVTRASSRGLFGVGNNDGLPSQYQVPPTTPSRRARISPLGLQSAGMHGLYGGRENGDDEQIWVDGVRFSNAEVRLWGLRDAADDGQTFGDTPEREEWAIGRH